MDIQKRKEFDDYSMSRYYTDDSQYMEQYNDEIGICMKL